MKLNSLLVAVIALFTWTSALAEHPLGTIRGDQIDLKTSDHAIAGSIKDFVVWGFVNEETGSSNLIMRKDGQIIEAVFKKQADGRFGGEIRHTVDSKERVTAIYFSKLDVQSQTMTIKINDQDVVVSIAGELKEGHFLNPVFSATVNGQQLGFSLEGDACPSFSFHLIAMIFGAYVH